MSLCSRPWSTRSSTWTPPGPSWTTTTWAGRPTSSSGRPTSGGAAGSGPTPNGRPPRCPPRPTRCGPRRPRPRPPRGCSGGPSGCCPGWPRGAKRAGGASRGFPVPAPCGRTPLTAAGLSKSYGSLEVFADVDVAVDRGSRVVILGLNGAGKTTLLRLLAGIEAPDTGAGTPGHGLRLGYYAQEHETLDVEATVLENMRSAAPDLTESEQRTVLGSFLFTGDDVSKPAGVLSGGEKTRLALALLVVSGANVLLLDEPTNNLDPPRREEGF